MALVVLAKLLTDGPPVIFRQDRVTYKGRIMRIMKFRTVSRLVNPDSHWTVDNADCSPIGQWLRSTHLDELPQLFNVIRGDMSLVGPRPERPFFTARFAKKFPRYEDRHRTNTGVTGWAQVHGLNGDTSISERVRFDNYYIEHWSLWLDVSVLILTLVQPLAGALGVRRSRREGPARISRAIETGESGKSMPLAARHENLARPARDGARRHGAAGRRPQRRCYRARRPGCRGLGPRFVGKPHRDGWGHALHIAGHVTRLDRKSNGRGGPAC
jgi:lipopolysaccharide/colanic/teichoic acid biosynthesis glycosyltransferase